MSLKLSSSFVPSLINLITVIGFILSVGSVSVLAIAYSIDHSVLFIGLNAVFPLVIVGVIIIWIASKLSEVLE